MCERERVATASAAERYEAEARYAAAVAAATASGAPAPFRGPVADSVLGERLIDVLGIVAAMGYASEVSHYLTCAARRGARATRAPSMTCSSGASSGSAAPQRRARRSEGTLRTLMGER